MNSKKLVPFNLEESTYFTSYFLFIYFIFFLISSFIGSYYCYKLFSSQGPKLGRQIKNNCWKKSQLWKQQCLTEI